MSGCAEVGGVTEGIDLPRRGHHPVTVAAVVGHYRNSCARTAPDPWARPCEERATECKNPTVRGHHEVAAIISRRHHSHNGSVETVRQTRTGRVEAKTGDRTVELGVAKTEDASIRGVKPVPALVFASGRYRRRTSVMPCCPSSHRTAASQHPGRSLPSSSAHEPVSMRRDRRCAAEGSDLAACAVQRDRPDPRTVVSVDAPRVGDAGATASGGREAQLSRSQSSSRGERVPQGRAVVAGKGPVTGVSILAAADICSHRCCSTCDTDSAGGGYFR